MTGLARLSTALVRLLAALTALLALAAPVVGVPWGLATFIGWPLPDHIPTRGEIQATLLNPLSVTLLLDILACIAWPTWLIFAVDVARCVPEALRGVRPPAIGPVHAVAAVLVASAVLSLLQPRFPATGAHPPPSPTLVAAETGRTASANTDGPVVASRTIHPHHPQRQDDTVVVRPPQHGIHDSLWRIAERELGDGRRWGQLFRINRGRPQPDGGALTDPHLIHPGWVLELPTGSTTRPTDQDPRPQPPSPPAPDVTPDRHPAPNPQAVRTTSNTAITLWSGGLVAASVATAVALAMVIRRRRRRRDYTPGGGDRTPPPAPAPAVHALRLAYDTDHLDDTEPRTPAQQPRDSVPTAGEPDPDDGSVDIAVRDDRARAIDLAAVQGLGLTGAGAEAAARALLVHLLAATRATVVIPADDARSLVGNDLPETARMHLTHDLPSAIAALAQHAAPEDVAAHQTTELDAVLLARIDRPQQQLQSILDAGFGDRIAGILLGHWPAGATVRVHTDGIVSAASPAIEDLRGARLFHLDATDTRDLLALLADTPPPPTSAPQPTTSAVDEQHLDTHEPGHTLESEPPATEGNEPTSETASAEAAIVATVDVPVLAETDEQAHPQPDRPWTLSIFGPLSLTWCSPDDQRYEVTDVLAPKHKALLVFLALHPSGTTRDAIREALWPDAGGRRPFNALYASLSQMRKAYAQATDDRAVDLIRQRDEQIALDPDVVDVDYWCLHDAEHDRRTAATDDERLAAWSRIVAAYRGDIADGMSALWLEGPREAAHRSVVDALAGMAAHYRDRDPHRQLQLLEHARLLNPENEDIYRDIMRVQAKLGYTDAIARTVQLLTTALAEIGERPDPTTLTLARALQERHHQTAI